MVNFLYLLSFNFSIYSKICYFVVLLSVVFIPSLVFILLKHSEDKFNAFYHDNKYFYFWFLKFYPTREQNKNIMKTVKNVNRFATSQAPSEYSIDMYDSSRRTSPGGSTMSMAGSNRSGTPMSEQYEGDNESNNSPSGWVERLGECTLGSLLSISQNIFASAYVDLRNIYYLKAVYTICTDSK